MDIRFYENLQTAFINIRRLSTEGCYDEVLFNKTTEDILLARATLSAQNPTTESAILLYCIDTLFEIINENNREKLCDFADTIHNMPEIAVRKRSFKSFRREIKAFRKKYGKAYFAYFDSILSNGIITPLSVGIFNLISPFPLMIIGLMSYYHILAGIGMGLLGYTVIPAWFTALALLPVFISPVLTIAGIIYGFLQKTKKHARLCVALSAIGLLINIALIFSLLFNVNPY
ncbi:MAG: hypothetical protein UD936_06105 [Acutalibacteraceae bacterium]|nr:hypothetical protein [Acutalibacteraceae bacterium]